MVKFAVLKTGGKQYRVSEGDAITVEKLSKSGAELSKGDKVSFDNILLVDDGKATEVGDPYLKGVEVEGELISEAKGRKVTGVKFKNKTRQRTGYGHRQIEAKVRISKIKT